MHSHADERPYLITSSASASNVGGTSRRSALAVWRLITELSKASAVGCSTASSDDDTQDE